MKKLLIILLVLVFSLLVLWLSRDTAMAPGQVTSPKFRFEVHISEVELNDGK